MRTKSDSPRYLTFTVRIVVGILLLRLIFVDSYYQVIMMIDIFQYSNMYTLRKSMQWLADEDHIKGECGPYVTKPRRYQTG